MTGLGRLSLWALLLAVLLVGREVAHGEPSGPKVEVASPKEGEIVGPQVTVRGYAHEWAEGARLRVNGAETTMKGREFETVIDVPQDGPFKLRVEYAVMGVPATVVERNVVVDGTSPALEILAPATELSYSTADFIDVGGVASDPHLKHVKMNDKQVQVTPEGRFAARFPLSDEEDTHVTIEAADRAGNRTVALRVIRPGPTPAGPDPSVIPPPPLPADAKSGEPIAFALRLKRGRGLSLGETAASQKAVDDGLRWLASHQSPNGGWEAAGFDRWCEGKGNGGDRPDGPGKALYDVGVTGLALCAFLAVGHTDHGEPAFAKTVADGLAYLVGAQDAAGRFGAHTMQHYNYNHAAASLALVEAYGLTGNAAYLASAQKALDYIKSARNPYFAWRYGVKPGDNDSSVTGWMIMPLWAAKMINAEAVKGGKAPPLVIDQDAFEGIRAWFEKMTDPEGRGGYLARGQGAARPIELAKRFPPERSEYPTAVGMLARIFVNDPKRSGPVAKGATLCLKLPPSWDLSGSIDFPYWYFGSLALFQVGGSPWQRWNGALHTALVHNQRMEGTHCGFNGSWDPIDPWSSEGGRVYSTALSCLALATPSRYERVKPN